MEIPTTDTAIDAVRVQKIDGLPLAVIPNGYRLQHLQRYESELIEPVGATDIDSIDSLVSYITSYRDDRTAIFAHRDTGRITAILDGLEGDAPGWCRHTAVFSLKLTPEWQAWNKIAGRELRQVELAEFLEENHDCIHEPTPVDVIAAVNTLSGKRNITFESSRKLDNGDVAIVWKEETTTGGNETSSNKFPSELVLHLPVYVGAEAVTTFAVRALLRYRINEGKLSFELKLIRPDKAIDQAFGKIVEALTDLLTSEDTKPRIYQGRFVTTPDTIHA